MSAIHLLPLVWSAIKNDRVIHAGATTSGVSLWGSYSMASIGTAQAWVAFFAAVCGGLSALAVFVLTCIKIRRLLNNPKATE